MKTAREYLSGKLEESRKRLRDYLRQGITPERIALAVSLGVFIALIPMVGVHSFLAVTMAWMLRVNPVIVFVGTQISNPFTFPFQLVLSSQTGHLLMYGSLLPLDWSGEIQWMETLVWPTLVGSLALAIVFCPLTYLATHRFLARR